MKIEIKSINNLGDYDKEYVTLTVKTDCDAGNFILADTTYASDGQVSSLLRHTFWLPDKAVKAGDFIRVYTKAGTSKSVKNTLKTTTHKFYWGLKNAVWNDDGDCAIIHEISNWSHKSVK